MLQPSGSMQLALAEIGREPGRGDRVTDGAAGVTDEELLRTHFGKNVNDSACVAAIDSGPAPRPATSRVSRRS